MPAFTFPQGPYTSPMGGGASNQNPWFNHPFGGGFGQGFPTAPIGDWYLNRGDMRPGYTIATSGYGGGNNPFGQFVQSQYPRATQGYEAALAYDPNLKWTDYLTRMGGEQFFRSQFNALSPNQRGEFRGRFVPPARWQIR